MILAGDIGGTKANLALFQKGQVRNVVKEERFYCKDYKTLKKSSELFCWEFLMTLNVFVWELLDL